MEHGLETSQPSNTYDYLKNRPGNPTMANFSDEVATDSKQTLETLKVNGEDVLDPFNDAYSSESDILVIDESIPKQKKKGRGRTNKKSRESEKKVTVLSPEDSTDVPNEEVPVSNNKLEIQNHITAVQPSEVPQECLLSVCSENTQENSQSNTCDESVTVNSRDKVSNYDDLHTNSVINNNLELLTHSNPFFHESLFELSQLHQTDSSEIVCTDLPPPVNPPTVKIVKPKPKLKEYAQYLGLQPAIQFKCPKCGKSGFESLVTLQEHFLNCTAIHSVEKSTEGENVSGFKLTRKVFLCSACGSYYENWNLYIHMLEYHRRYICLYCLGMFSVLDDLCQHIESRHNLEPGIKDSLEDFYNTYNDPCYIICCECNQQFNEGDNFFYHHCVSPKLKNNKKSKQVIAPENHVTGDFGAVCDDAAKDNHEAETQGEIKTEELAKSPCDVPVPVTDVQGDNNDKHHSSDDLDVSNNSDSDSCKSNDNLPSKSFEDKSTDHLDGSKSNEEEINNTDSLQNHCEGDSLPSGPYEMNQQPSSKEKVFHESIETRKVPKLSLKLPKLGMYQHQQPTEDSDDSDKLNAEVDNIESENENENENVLKNEQHNEHHSSDQEEEGETELHNGILEHSVEEGEKEEEKKLDVPQYAMAGCDVAVIEIELDQPLDKMDITILLQKCLRASVSSCIYCNHARRIAVNGKQLGLHAMSEHRYSAINKSITEEELIPDSFNIRIKECLDYLETVFFNLDSGVSGEAVTFSHVFECFQCHYSTTVHKELYLHNRKFHSKNLLLCIMCKSNFYSYSELICHLCPGLYVLDCDINFRCCMCVSGDLPSAFRLMVHLRKRHNVCDVCLEMCHSQYKLSNHVWKHKLHHFCYRCGIAYRNKPDITRHLFWKHGTESVLCKKCLQKKWPHVYHFCVPPSSFTCEECSLVFTKAVSLKVHKRLHTDERKHHCNWEDCPEAFISNKLMLKHLKWHTDPPGEVVVEEEVKEEPVKMEEGHNVDTDASKTEGVAEEEASKTAKPKVDVYNLPELNLSESDSSDSENDTENPPETSDIDKEPSIEESHLTDTTVQPLEDVIVTPLTDTIVDNNEPERVTEACEIEMEPPVEDTSSAVVMQDIWDNFKNYQASKEKMDHMLIGEPEFKVDKPYVPDIPIPVVEEGISWQLALRDHDYCCDPEKVQPPADAIIEVKPSLESAESIDHDYCTQKDGEEGTATNLIPAVPSHNLINETRANATSDRKRTNSSSSSSSESSDSSCACGSSCSCSDSSSGSSSPSSNSSNSDSSSEEGRKRQQQRRLKRRERNKGHKKGDMVPAATAEQESQKESIQVEQLQAVATEMPILESDLETTESETDEEFYDREPHKFAKKILEERRAQLIAEMGPNVIPNGSFIESTSRPPTPPEGTIETEPGPKKKKKSKKRKKRRSEKKALQERSYSATIINAEPIVPPPPPSVPYYQQFHQMESQTSPTVAPITLSISRYSPITAPQTPPLFQSSMETPSLTRQESTASDSSVRASKRRRVRNKFYGYSSEEESDNKPPHLKRAKLEINRTIPAPSPPMLVPPITIKTVPTTPIAVCPRTPLVEPITLKLPKTQHVEKHRRRPPIPPIRLLAPRRPIIPPKEDSATESNDSDMDDDHPAGQLHIAAEPPKLPQPQLYCYCRCPYDEVSEMIGCDSNDCQIEWFHFECVGIMVPPKGQWFCPDCRKKKHQQRLIT